MERQPLTGPQVRYVSNGSEPHRRSESADARYSGLVAPYRWSPSRGTPRHGATSDERVPEVTGRPERPIAPHLPYAAFARGLRELRQRAGRPPYRQMAYATGFSVSVMSEAANGTRLPTWEVTAAYVRACDGDLDEWRQRWHDAARAGSVRGTAIHTDQMAPLVISSSSRAETPRRSVVGGSPSKH
ncbi:helix-turn-helix domain-containing protein, partial [Actinoplanes italicus]|uniref:helix-turn-helix domain-containing protein n=1 Tax=Actinoplanes italicus TaxID=113567 RepID=UPI0027DE369C